MKCWHMIEGSTDLCTARTRGGFPPNSGSFSPKSRFTSRFTFTTWLSAIYVVYLRHKLSALYLCFTCTLPVGGKEAQSWGKSQKDFTSDVESFWGKTGVNGLDLIYMNNVYVYVSTLRPFYVHFTSTLRPHLVHVTPPLRSLYLRAKRRRCRAVVRLS